MATKSLWTRGMKPVPSISTHELIERMRQQVTARWDAKRCQHGHDFARELPQNFLSSAGHFFFEPPEVETLCTLLRQRLPGVAADIVTRAEKICRHQFDLLGYEGLDYGAEIDWHLDLVHGKRSPRKPWFKVRYLDFNEVGDSKVTWELNRHQHLVTLAKAYRLCGDEKFAREIIDQWKHWQVENPYPIGMNWASSLEVAFRSLSWTWVYFLLDDTAVLTPELRHEWARALAISGRHVETYLSTYSSPSTHLLGQAVALFFLGSAFPELPKAQRWQDKGWNILLEAAASQVRTDGFYCQRSTYYHVYALDLFLHARVLAAIRGTPVPTEFDVTLVQMLDALCLLGRAGVPPRWGDDDGGRVFDPRRNRVEHMLDPLSTGAALFGKGDWKFAAGGLREETLWLLGPYGLAVFDELKSSPPSTDPVALRASGFYLMPEAETGQQLAIDAGPHGPGHGHADALSVTLGCDGRTLLLDPGTFEYAVESGERAPYRGTGAHNTLRVDGRDQADSVGPFRWANAPVVRVESWSVGEHFALFTASHDGYARLAEPVTHRRWVFHRRGQFWFVRDVAAGQGTHQLEVTWHLGPALSPVSTRDNLFADGEGSLGLVTVEGHRWSQSAHRGTWSPVYGQMERAMVLTFSSSAILPAEFITLLVRNPSARAGVGRLQEWSSNGTVRAYRYASENEEHQFFFPETEASWRLGNWASDARFLYWSWDRSRDSRMLVIGNGSYCETGGVRILSSERVVEYVEVVSSGSKDELLTSDSGQVRLLGSLDRVEMELAAAGSDPKPTVS
jgi:hypothetical protein